MTQKKRISDEAFPWVKKTSSSKKSEESKGITEMKKSLSKKKTETSLSEPQSQTEARALNKSTPLYTYSAQTVFVEYDAEGEIQAIARVERNYLPEGKKPLEENENFRFDDLKVPSELEKLSLFEIHQKCRVSGIGQEPYLVVK